MVGNEAAQTCKQDGGLLRLLGRGELGMDTRLVLRCDRDIVVLVALNLWRRLCFAVFGVETENVDCTEVLKVKKED